MNARQLEKKVGEVVKLRPLPARRTTLGEELSRLDDDWRLRAVSALGVELHNIRTGHVITLGGDNIREFRTPNFLLLRCQLTLEGQKVLIEPT